MLEDFGGDVANEIKFEEVWTNLSAVAWTSSFCGIFVVSLPKGDLWNVWEILETQSLFWDTKTKRISSGSSICLETVLSKPSWNRYYQADFLLIEVDFFQTYKLIVLVFLEDFYSLWKMSLESSWDLVGDFVLHDFR